VGAAAGDTTPVPWAAVESKEVGSDSGKDDDGNDGCKNNGNDSASIERLGGSFLEDLAGSERRCGAVGEGESKSERWHPCDVRSRMRD
jgi:hypothetical protein